MKEMIEQFNLATNYGEISFVSATSTYITYDINIFGMCHFPIEPIDKVMFWGTIGGFFLLSVFISMFLTSFLPEKYKKHEEDVYMFIALILFFSCIYFYLNTIL